MRVISGTAKSRKLKAVPGDTTRPITDRVKEALFDIIGDNVVGARFLDLFAGTGGVGIEALSRGAREAVFVENGRHALDTVRFNLEATKLGAHARVVRASVFDFLQREPQPFEYIYVAPPQYQELWIATLRLIDQQPGWLARDGEIVVQIHPREYRPIELQHFEPIEERRYGSTLLIFYAYRESDTD
ncbi:MAG TPA: 16S rRNA (guanine(966)-N(2))-methyltransferase RsmD [Anaerolineae bacterium]|nr:16S rRNA (guanine(966)-N(2))-methyltransferase RsmD [Anaerolineae bacterium]